MFDVFYSGKKPGLFAHEHAADSIEHAQSLSRTRFFWWINYLSDYTGFDFLWEPVPWQAHYRHAWPNQHQPDSRVYLVPKTWNGKDTHYHAVPVIHYKPEPECWSIPAWIDSESIDKTWSPDPEDPAYIYHFPVEWGWDHIGGPEYQVLGATEHKYVYDFVSRTRPDPDLWYQHTEASYTSQLHRWRPNPTDPPYDYVFGNQWYSAEVMPTVEYRMPGATSKKYMNDLGAILPEQHNNWNAIQDCDWDYSWVPNPGDPPYIYVFGNQHWSAEIMPTVTYTVPGATERKYMDYPRAQLLATHEHWFNITHHNYKFDYSWTPDPGEPPMIYVFGNQHWPAEKMPMLRYCSEPVDEGLPIKYMDYPRATLLPNKAMWVLPEGVREEQVDFSWVPDPGEPPYIYQFATQWQKTGGPQYHVPGATETKYLEHVEIKIETATVPIVEIDHLDGNAGQIPNAIKKARYFDNYRDTLIRLAKNLKGEHEFVWVCSSICDYSEFDFSWHPEKWQSTMLHVFASDEQKFGDTFYMHVPTFAERAEKKQLLEWYSVNYVPKIRVPRRPIPVITHNHDSQADAVCTQDWSGPLALFTNTNYVSDNLVTVPLWRENVKTIVPLSKGATSVIVPKTAVPYVKTQLYDYAYIDKTHRMLKDQPLDIVFISNGEKDAEANYSWLTTVCRTSINNIHWSDGVSGRVAAYHAAAEMSTTPWFFAVFAKLQVEQNFDWSWQPDRMQAAKHYIFHARNTINDLEYGHQGMIAYNKRLVLENTGQGLDFTLDQPHEVVPILSGEAIYYTSNWIAWRTAFREALKLRASLPDVENEYRLKVWLDVDHGAGKWSSKGAQDAVDYYEEVGGDFAALKKSYEWEWLASYAFVKRNLVVDR